MTAVKRKSSHDADEDVNKFVPKRLLQVDDTIATSQTSKTTKLRLYKNLPVELDGGRKLIVIIERASLEIVKNNDKYELLNCDRLRHLAKKLNRDPATCRPDILHQCLLMLQDSPLNLAGYLQVFVRTELNVLFWVHPQCRIPRTYERFAGLMVQLLHELSVKADGENKPLMKVIKNPVTDHLPIGCRKIAMELHSGPPVRPIEVVSKGENADKPIVVSIGGMAHGSINNDYSEESVSISAFPLSGALTCAKVCSAFEEAWNVL